MKTIQKHPFCASSCSFFSKIIGLPLPLLILILLGSQTAQAIQMPLGAINFSNPVNPNQQTDWNLANVVDGNIVTQIGVAEGFGVFGSTGQANFLQLNVGLTEINFDNPNQSVEYYTFSISVYYAWNELHGASAFTLSYSNDNAVSFVKITDILSASTNNENTELTFDTNGNIAATEPPGGSPLEVHNVEFNVANDITHLRYNIGPFAGWTGPAVGNGNVTISEFEGIAIAEVVPEPSTYALIAGLATFAFIAFRRKQSKA